MATSRDNTPETATQFVIMEKTTSVKDDGISETPYLNPCRCCDQKFTQWHSRAEHEKYACKNIKTQPRPKFTGPSCYKQVSKPTLYSHRNNGSPTSVRACVIPRGEPPIFRYRDEYTIETLD